MSESYKEEALEALKRAINGASGLNPDQHVIADLYISLIYVVLDASEKLGELCEEVTRIRSVLALEKTERRDKVRSA